MKMTLKILQAAYAAACKLCEYNDENKAEFAHAGQAFFRALAADLGVPKTWVATYNQTPSTHKTVSYNAGGFAVAGDHSLTAPEFGLYLTLSCRHALAVKDGYFRMSTPDAPYGALPRSVNIWVCWPSTLDEYTNLLQRLQTCAVAGRALALSQSSARL
jgi:hypothetical protein